MNNTLELIRRTTEEIRPALRLSSIALNGGSDFERHGSLLTGTISKCSKIPPYHSLSQNTVSSFTSVTEIRFGLPKSGKVSLKLYNMESGKFIEMFDSERLLPGAYTYNFNTCELNEGNYYYSLVVDDMLISIKQLELRK